ncbi:MAG: outer membrane beta-barrel protein, partial [Hoeflea sp.]|nr:outer membrane beta-barrel protein [Hoeflea sp.]
MRTTISSAAFAAIIFSSICSPALAEDQWYFGGEVGGTWLGDQPGYWQSPGPGDPRITYDIDGDTTFAGFISVGKTLMDGVRADVSLGFIGDQDIQANWVSPTPTGVGKPNDHANMTTSVSAISGMFNVSIEPLTLTGNTGKIQPFVSAGIGIANVKMGNWTRTNLATVFPAGFRPIRSFVGDDSTNFAWSIGAGVSIDMTET